MATTYTTPGVYVEEMDSGSKPLTSVATAVAAFVGFTAKAPPPMDGDPDGRRPRLVTSWTQYLTLFGDREPGLMLPQAVYGYFQNGGQICYIVRIPHRRDTGDRPPLELQAADGKPVLEVRAKDPHANLNITVQPTVAPPGQGEGDGEGEGGADPRFTLMVESGTTVVERWPNLTLGKDLETATAKSALVTVRAKGATKAPVKVAVSKPIPPQATETLPVHPSDFAGVDLEPRTGIASLGITDDVTMVAVPDLVTVARNDDGTLNEDTWNAVQLALIEHCANEANRVAILDAPPGKSPQEMLEWRERSGYDSMFAALYYPWIKVNNPAGTNGDRTMSVPPCGHMAGIWARTDQARGVWKAPANEVVQNALAVDMPVTKVEQGLLNPLGVNCIRPFGTNGIRVWGARTLTSNPSWQYLNVRRLFNMIETTIMEQTQWAVFEPNDMALWQKVKRTVFAYLRTLWREGALFGATPAEAFYVKCDADNNTQETIDLGQLIVEIGIAPVKPAEFVIFRISQWQGGSAATE